MALSNLPREERRFGEAENHATHEDTSEVVDLTGHRRHQTPSDNEESKVPGGSTAVVQGKVTRQLGQDIRTEEERETDLILIACEAEVFLKTLQTCGCIIVAVSL
jgi:hypothetical protein